MNNKTFKILIILLSTIFLNSCTFTTSGESLEAFSRRMNELNQNYNMTSNGYIIDSSQSSLSKFFKFSDKEILLNFKYDKKHRLNEMNLVFEPIILEENTASFTFLCDCIKSFCQNENATEKILKETDFEKTITEINMKTISAEADNIKIEIDTTQLGTVITLYRDI